MMKIPKSKFQVPKEFQVSIPEELSQEDLEFGIWRFLELGTWNLVFFVE